MAVQSLVYRFIGNFSNLQGGLTAASRSVTNFNRRLMAANAEGERMRRGLEDLGGTAGRIGLVAGVGLGAAVMASANFEQAMSSVKAATHETAENMDLLRDAAIKAGASTSFSATEAAQAIEELSKAGVSTSDILGGGLAGSMDLAAAGGLEVGAAAEIAASALTQFKLAGEDVPHVADLLAAGAGKAQGEVTDLAAALNQSGLVAAQTGLSIEETVGSLSALADAGLTGSDAGTSFKTMLMSLTPNSKQAAKAMRTLGIRDNDAQGQFVGMAEFAGQLQGALSGLSAEQQNATLKTIFGSDAVRAASVMFSQGSAGVKEWTEKVNDAGYASETASTKLDNLKGDWEELSGAIETALIGTGDGSTGILRELTQGATALTNAFNGMPSVLKEATGGLLALTALVGGGIWAGSRAVRGITATRSAFNDLGVTAAGAGRRVAATWGPRGIARDLRSMRAEYAGLSRSQALLTSGMSGTTAAAQRMSSRLRTAGKSAAVLAGVGLAVSGIADGFGLANTAQMGLMGAAFGPWGAGIGIAAGFAMDLAGGFGASAREAEKAAASAERVKALMSTLDDEGKATADTIAGIYSTISDGQREVLSDLGLNVDALIKDAIEGGKGAAEAVEEVRSALAAAIDMDDVMGDRSKIDEQYAALESLNAAIGDGEKVHDAGAKAAKDHARAEESVGKAADAEAESIVTLINSMDELRDARLKSQGGVDAFEASLDGVTKSLEENGRTLDRSTDAGRSNRAALRDLVTAWNELDAPGRKAIGGFERARQSMIDAAQAAGMGSAAAEKYADELMEIPPNVVTKLEALGGDTAILKTKGLKAYLATVPREVKAELKAMGTDIAKARIDQVKAAMDRVRDKDVTVRVRTINEARTNYAGQGKGAFDPRKNADGGTVPKTGLPYADRHHYLLADGEEVISNRHGQADRNRALLKAINSNRLADGGTVGLANGGTVGIGTSLNASIVALMLGTKPKDLSVDQLTVGMRALGLAMREQSRETKQLSRVTDKATNRYESWTSKLEGLSDSVADKFDRDLFGADDDRTPFVAGQSSDPLAKLRAENADLEKQQKLQNRAAALGLKGAAFDEFASKASLSEMDSLLSDPARVKQYQRLYNKNAALRERVGDRAGAIGYGEQRDVAKKQLAIAQRQERASERREKQLERRHKQAQDERKKQTAAIKKAASSRKNTRKGK